MNTKSVNGTSKPWGTLKSINSYPVKGFSGHQLCNVDLRVGKGLPGDRQWAISNGSQIIPGDGRWTGCKAFVRMTKEEGLPLFGIKTDDFDNLKIVHPNGTEVLVQDSPESNVQLDAWFGHTGADFSQSVEDLGYWDHPDAMLSIINLTTVRALSHVGGIDLDPSRFRGNLLIETDEPWNEFSLVGHRVRIGDAEIEFLRPINRCKATSVNPKTGKTDVNLPHLLASQYGHIYCGVYARVVKAGQITNGNKLDDIGVSPQAIRDAANSPSAPTAENWPRTMKVIERIRETESVTSFWLEDPLAQRIEPIAPCSYLRLHVQGPDGPMSRSYTISGHSSDGKRLRLSIKKEEAPALFSPWAHEFLHDGTTVVASGPFVDPSLAWRSELTPDRSVLILTAGIGITMGLSVLNSIDKAKVTGTIRIGHSTRREKDLGLWQDILEATRLFADAKAHLYITRPDVMECADLICHKGRMDLPDIASGIDIAKAQIFLCGPANFGVEMRAKLVALGAAAEHIHEDIFASPKKAITETRTASHAGPLAVRFVDDECDATWTPETGSLLDLADLNGVSIPANCRSGACRVCLTQVDGQFEYLTEPVTPAPKGWAYLCCSAPLGPLIVGKYSTSKK